MQLSEMSKKQILHMVWILIVWVVLGILFYAFVDVTKLTDKLKSTNLSTILIVVLPLLGGYVFYTLRWLWLLPKEARFKPTFHAGNVGHLLNMWIPARTGEVARIVVLHKSQRLPAPELVSSVMVERWYETIMHIFSFSLAAILATNIDSISAIVILFLIVGGVTVGTMLLIIHYQERILATWPPLLGRLPWITETGVRKVINGLLLGFTGAGSTRRLVIAFAWSIVMWLLFCVYHLLVLMTMDIRVSAPEAMTMIMVAMATVPPSTAMKPVAYQGILVGTLLVFGFEATETTAYAILLQIPQILWVTVAGLWGLTAEPEISWHNLFTAPDSEAEEQTSG